MTYTMMDRRKVGMHCGIIAQDNRLAVATRLPVFFLVFVLVSFLSLLPTAAGPASILDSASSSSSSDSLFITHAARPTSDLGGCCCSVFVFVYRSVTCRSRFNRSWPRSKGICRGRRRFLLLHRPLPISPRFRRIVWGAPVSIYVE